MNLSLFDPSRVSSGVLSTTDPRAGIWSARTWHWWVFHPSGWPQW
jgi:hypothetical protein